LVSPKQQSPAVVHPQAQKPLAEGRPPLPAVPPPVPLVEPPDPPVPLVEPPLPLEVVLVLVELLSLVSSSPQAVMATAPPKATIKTEKLSFRIYPSSCQDI